jgi:hypothetical protein
MMSESPRGRDANPAQLSLEEWLQLSDQDRANLAGVCRDAEAESGDAYGIAIDLPELVKELHPDADSGPLAERKPSCAVIDLSAVPDEASATPVANEVEKNRVPETKDEKAQICDLEALLAREFSDTLTGFNAVAGPLGISLLVLCLVGWLCLPLIQIARTGEAIRSDSIVLMGVSILLGLAGLHLVLYWSAHRGSNLVKTRELDRLLEARRVTSPCIHLDCEEAPIKARIETGGRKKTGLGGRSSPAGDLCWRCTSYGVGLEGLPLCAVCDRYEPGGARHDDGIER